MDYPVIHLIVRLIIAFFGLMSLGLGVFLFMGGNRLSMPFRFVLACCFLLCASIAVFFLVRGSWR